MAARRFIALLSLLPAFALASPSPDDTLLANAEQERPAFLDTLKTLVNLDSGTGDVDDLEVGLNDGLGLVVVQLH